MKAIENHRETILFPQAEVRAALGRVLASESFQRSPQLQRFLRFVVEETLSGDPDRLKEYVVGTEVFGRPANYDPRLDSLVRVEARRLRALLDAYYRTHGLHDPIAIELAKGSYVPSFQPRIVPEPPPTVSVAHRPWFARPWLIAAAVSLVVLLAPLLYRAAQVPQHRLPANPTIAVLPFDNLTSDPENQYFCFGLLDEITTDLAKSSELRVVARTSAARFKRGDDIATIGRQLKADAVLEGSVQKSDGRVRVNAQLINTADNLHIWSESYERSSDDLLRAQDEIARAIHAAVWPHLTSGGAAPPHHPAFSADAEANQLYWKGAYFRSPMGRTGWRNDLVSSARYFEQAVERDPQFAMAYAALADVDVSLAWERGGSDTTSDLITRGRNAAQRALELDGNLAEAHAALGAVQFFYDYDGQTAEESFQHALRLDPSNAKARMWYAMFLAMRQRSEEAIAQAQQAKLLDPLSYISTTHLAVIYFFGRRYEEAAALARETVQVADTAPGHALLGMTYEAQQNYEAAIEEYRTGLKLVPSHGYIKGMLGHAYARSGRTAEAVALLKDTKLAFDQGGLSDLRASYIYVGLGDRDRVFQLLERAYVRHDPDLPSINVDPVFDPIRGDARFLALLRKMHLAG